MSPNASESEIMEEASMSYTGSVSLADVKVPQDFSPSLVPAVDHNMFFDLNGRRKRLWLVTVPPNTDPEDLEGAKVKKNKCVIPSGSKRYDVATRTRKEHQAVVVHKDLEAVAVRMRLAGTVSFRERIEVPELEFALPEDKRSAPRTDACQRFVPFGSDMPKVHSRELPEGGKLKRRKKKKRSERQGS
ncbi:uncharacterized protein LOC100904722 [Galendromus occidentalis]|uniref:Uncharacterized protein LOC100904722 n=1 Tax=Galendromus occidentalis TaxID=34638 RepID=A0AAJ6QX57_9ACAR|nr:uncharacterized protein LOC100904722 [Galendromus occidentalis]